jgi:predicted protein tyrosine phosphatase
VCQGGNSRSVGAAYVFKSRGHAAVAIGHSHAGEGLMELLCTWADLIVVMEPSICQFVPARFHDKAKVCNVGTDTYFLGYKQELMTQVEKFANDNAL